MIDLSTCSSTRFIDTLCDADFCGRSNYEKDFGIGKVEENHRRFWTIEKIEDTIQERMEVEQDHLVEPRFADGDEVNNYKEENKE